MVSQYAAIAALEYGEAHIAAFRRAFKERRDRTLEHLDALSYIFDYQKPEGAYFVFPRVKDIVPWARDSRRLAHRLLEEAKVAVVPGVAFGPSGEAHLRLNFGRELADIDTAFERLAHYFRQRTPAFVQVETPAATPVTSGFPTTVESTAATWQSLMSRRHLRQLAIPYLQALARIFLRRKKPLVIAIAGNRGKTVMKRLFGELLSSHYKVRTNPRSYNTEIGLPLAVLNLEIETQSPWNVLRTLGRAAWIAFCSQEKLEVLVLELGVRQRGDMHELLRTVQPDIAVLTTLTPSYSNDVELLHTLQDEMRVLCQTLGADCHFLVDDEDLLLREVVGTLPTAPVPLRSAQWSANGQGFTLQSNGHMYSVTRELVGESERVSVQAAVLLAERWTKLTPVEISRFLAEEEGQTAEADRGAAEAR